jgi:hypothetical protein
LNESRNSLQFSITEIFNLMIAQDESRHELWAHETASISAPPRPLAVQAVGSAGNQMKVRENVTSEDNPFWRMGIN